MLVNCELLEIPFDIATCVLYLFIVITFTLLGLYIIMKRDSFHPFFSILLASFVISYGLCDLFSLLILTLNILGVPDDDDSIQFMRRFEDIFYIYASPCAVSILVERIFASCRPSRYESNRPWPLMLLAQVLCIGISVGIVSSEYWAALQDLQQWCLVGLQAFVIVASPMSKMSEILSPLFTVFAQFTKSSTNYLIKVSYLLMIIGHYKWTLIVLLVVNRIRTQREIGNGNLRLRYQMAENISALRLIIPIVLADALVTLVDIVFEMVYSVNVVFDRKMCALPEYTVLFIIFKTIRIVLELAIPTVIMVLHPSVKKTAAAKCCCGFALRWNPREFELRNVLGRKIRARQSMEEYFLTLRSEWNI